MADEEQTYETLDLEGNRDLLVAAGSNTLPEQDWSRNGDNYKRATINALGVTENHAHIKACFRDALPDSAGEATAGRWGGIVGVPRTGATAASAPNAGKIRGVAASTWLATDALVHKSGLRFRPTDAGVLGGGGEALVGIIAIDVGSQTRLSAGETLTWESPPPGLEATVELVADLDEGGLDAEELGPYRNRYLNRFAQPRKGGSVNDYVGWIQEQGYPFGYAYPHRNGRGSMDVAALKAGTGSARLLDAGERADLLAFLETVRPGGVTGIRVLEVVTYPSNISAVIEPQEDPQYAPDWTPETPMSVDSWTAATRTLVFGIDRPPSMSVGDRVIPAGSNGVQLVIEAFSGSDAVVLADALGTTPSGAVYSGGPLIDPVRDGLIAMINGLGPRVGRFGKGWVSAIRVSEVRKVIQNTPGVFDHTLGAPIANLEATESVFPDDEWVALLIPYSILVRYLE